MPVPVKQLRHSLLIVLLSWGGRNKNGIMAPSFNSIESEELVCHCEELGNAFSTTIHVAGTLMPFNSGLP